MCTRPGKEASTANCMLLTSCFLCHGIEVLVASTQCSKVDYGTIMLPAWSPVIALFAVCVSSMHDIV